MVSYLYIRLGFLSFLPYSFGQFFCVVDTLMCIVVILQANKTVERVMSSIVCHSVFDIFTLLDMLHLLMNDLKSQVFYHTSVLCLLFDYHVCFDVHIGNIFMQIDCQVRMLIIDSLSSLIAPVLGGGGAHGIHPVNTYSSCVQYSHQYDSLFE